MDLVLPKVPKMKAMKDRPSFYLQKAQRKTSCILHRLLNGYDVLETNNATMKLLQLAGCDIVIPKHKVAAVHCMDMLVKRVEQKN